LTHRAIAEFCSPPFASARRVGFAQENRGPFNGTHPCRQGWATNLEEAFAVNLFCDPPYYNSFSFPTSVTLPFDGDKIVSEGSFRVSIDSPRLSGQRRYRNSNWPEGVIQDGVMSETEIKLAADTRPFTWSSTGNPGPEGKDSGAWLNRLKVMTDNRPSVSIKRSPKCQQFEVIGFKLGLLSRIENLENLWVETSWLDETRMDFLRHNSGVPWRLKRGTPGQVFGPGPSAPWAHRRPGYPLSGCVPAEPDSVSPGKRISPPEFLLGQGPGDTGGMPGKSQGVRGSDPPPE